VPDPKAREQIMAGLTIWQRLNITGALRQTPSWKDMRDTAITMRAIMAPFTP
jgi:hypothetical protein